MHIYVTPIQAKPDKGSPSQATSSQAVHTPNLEKEKVIGMIK